MYKECLYTIYHQRAYEVLVAYLSESMAMPNRGVVYSQPYFADNDEYGRFASEHRE